MRIGELAKKGRTSIKALHLYHELGLLEPDTVDESGHRIYSEHSLLMLQRLQSLKKLGFTLLEIQGLLNLKVPKLGESLEFQKSKIKEQLEKKKHELYRIEVAEKILAKSDDVAKVLQTVASLSEAENYLTLKEIKKIASINEQEQEIRELLADKTSWYEGLQEAYKTNIPENDPKVQIMAKKWNRYVSYWRKHHPQLTKKLKKMDQEKPRENLGVVGTPEFQAYVKRAIDHSTENLSEKF